MIPLDCNQPPPSGRVLIEASAGTGKTYSIANLFLWFVLKGIPPSEILVVTFTEAATQELKQRLRLRLDDAYSSIDNPESEWGALLAAARDAYDTDIEVQRRMLRSALLCFDEAAIYTIHGFCQRVLREQAFECGQLFEQELLTDDSILLEELVDDFIRRNSYKKLHLVPGLRREPLLRLSRLLKKQPDLKPDPLESFDLAAFETLLFSEELVERAGQLQDFKWRKNSLYSPFQWAAELEAFRQSYKDDATVAMREHCKLFSAVSITKAALKACKDAGLNQHAFFDLCDAFYGSEQCWWERLFIAGFHGDLEQIKKKRGVMTYDDLLLRLQAALDGSGGDALCEALRQRYRVALVDEFQDTDPIQYDIFQRIFSESEAFYMIGDPKQSIYRFRGADIHAYLLAGHQAESQLTLDTNYRSASGMVEAVNAFWTGQPGSDNPFAQEGISFFPVLGNQDEQRVFYDSSAALQLCMLSSEEKLKTDAVSKWVAAEMLNLLGQGSDPLVPADLAVLVRSNSQANEMCRRLRDLNVPAVVQNSGNVFQSVEAEDMEWLMQAFMQPSEKSLLALLISPLGCMTIQKAYDLSDQQRLVWLDKMLHYQDCWQRQGLLPAFNLYIEENGRLQHILARTGGERSMTNYEQLVELLHREEQAEGLSPEVLISRLRQRRSDQDAAADDAWLQRLDRDDDAVRVMTVHKSKGLEFNVVFAPYLWSKAMPRRPSGAFDVNDAGRLVLELGDSPNFEDRKALLQEAELGEQLRLLYVALTRAVQRCYLLCGPFSTAAKKAQDGALAWLAGDDGVESAWENLAAEHPDCIGFNHCSIDELSLGSWNPQLEANPDLSCASLPELEDDGWGVGSFSWLTRGGMHERPRDRDAADEKPIETKEAERQYAFPRGASAGNCVHDLFERHFRGESQHYADCLARQGLLPRDETLRKQRMDLLHDWSLQVLACPLQCNGDTFRLGDIPTVDALPEMEFYYHLEKINPGELAKLFRDHGSSDLVRAFADQVESLNFDLKKGAMNGFIDLVFRRDGQYFILDWKTNHLGNSPDSYLGELLADCMWEHRYILQYHIYVLALHLYLRQCLPDYSYEQHFGGVIYAFVRGMEPDCPGSGIYVDCPTEAMIEGMTDLLIRGNHA